MGKRKAQKNIIKIAAMTSMTIFSLMAVFTGTLAWFNANRVINNGSDNFAVEMELGQFNRMTFHNAVNRDGDTLQFDRNSFGSIEITDWSTKTLDYDFTQSPNYMMDAYDYLEKSHPVLALIELGEDSGIVATESTPVKVKARTETTYYLGDTTGEQKVLYTHQQIEQKLGVNPFSSAVSFTNESFASALELSATHGTYSTTIEGSPITFNTYDFDELDGLSSFVSFDSDSFDEFNSEIEVFNAPVGTTVKYIAVVFDYYEIAVEGIYNAFLGDPALEDELYFYCDWKLVI